MSDHDRLRASRRIAVLLDDLVRIPGTRQGVGADAVIGLIPGLGDLLGSGLSSVIMYDAYRARVPVPVLARMAWNLLLDTMLGLVPFAGDLADVAHRANRKNYLLLEAAVEANPDPKPPTPGYLLAALLLTVTPVLISVVVGVLVLWLVLGWIFR